MAVKTSPMLDRAVQLMAERRGGHSLGVHIVDEGIDHLVGGLLHQIGRPKKLEGIFAAFAIGPSASLYSAPFRPSGDYHRGDAGISDDWPWNAASVGGFYKQT